MIYDATAILHIGNDTCENSVILFQQYENIMTGILQPPKQSVPSPNSSHNQTLIPGSGAAFQPLVITFKTTKPPPQNLPPTEGRTAAHPSPSLNRSTIIPSSSPLYRLPLSNNITRHKHPPSSSSPPNPTQISKLPLYHHNFPSPFPFPETPPPLLGSLQRHPFSFPVQPT